MPAVTRSGPHRRAASEDSRGGGCGIPPRRRRSDPSRSSDGQRSGCDTWRIRGRGSRRDRARRRTDPTRASRVLDRPQAAGRLDDRVGSAGAVDGDRSGPGVDGSAVSGRASGPSERGVGIAHQRWPTRPLPVAPLFWRGARVSGHGSGLARSIDAATHFRWRSNSKTA